MPRLLKDPDGVLHLPNQEWSGMRQTVCECLGGRFMLLWSFDNTQVVKAERATCLVCLGAPPVRFVKP